MSYSEQDGGAVGSAAVALVSDEEIDGDALGFNFVKQLAADLSCQDLDLPPLPGIVTRVKSVLDDENSTVKQIARVIGAEPSLAARLLTIANSAAFSRGGAELTDLKSAVNRLGHDMVRTSAMSFAMQNLMDARTAAQLKPYLDALWQHSITVASIAYSLGKRARAVNADTASFVGLIHDIGKLYILTRLEDHQALFKCPEAMVQIMDDWHAEIGKTIVEYWNLPEHVAEAVSEHEDVGRDSDDDADLVDVVIASNLIANALEHEDGAQSLDYDGVSVFKRLHITAANFDEVVEESREEIDSLMSALRA